MTPKTHRETNRETLPGDNEPHIEKKRRMEGAIIEDADEAGDSGRDLVHGDGGTIDLPTGPGDLSKDD